MMISLFSLLPFAWISGLDPRYRPSVRYAVASNVISTSTQPPYSHATTQMTNDYSNSNNIISPSSLILIDVENLRGKTGFTWSHDDVLTAVDAWTNGAAHKNNVILLVDHGDDASSHYCASGSYAVTFAGPLQKADDLLVHDVLPYFLTHDLFFGKTTDHVLEATKKADSTITEASTVDKIVVVTADGQLGSRCRRLCRATGHKKLLQIVSPLALLQELTDVTSPSPPLPCFVPLGSNDLEVVSLVNASCIKVSCDFLQTELALRVNGQKRVSRKHRKVLQQRLQAWREGLGEDLVTRLHIILQQGATQETLQGLDHNLQQALYEVWTTSSAKRRIYRKETTSDRIVLAEQLRQQLIERELESKQIVDQDRRTMMSTNPALAYALQWFPSVDGNVEADADATTSDPPTVNFKKSGRPLRLVVISDTHGMEEQLGDTLPAGDVLLHLGDFAMDSPRGIPKDVSSYVKFDRWLSQQSHSIKIVLRGNHDPRKLEFSQSRAQYITRSCTIDVAGYTMAIIPFLRDNSGQRITNKCLPKACDILVSHVPPRGLLDRSCLNGQLAGSQTLRRGMERMKGGPPKLLLCGHIHEGRGALRSVLCGSQDTLVVNAANANAGVAHHIEYGATVLDVKTGSFTAGTIHRGISIVEMPGRYEYLRNYVDDSSFFATASEDKHPMYLLAVDLGLRTGVSLYDSRGRLLSYGDFLFASGEDLMRGASALLSEWEQQLSGGVISHIAIEGSDPPLLRAWREAATSSRHLLPVQPSEWRMDMLSPTEQREGLLSKAASRRIAREIVVQFGANVVLPVSEFNTDVAESMLMGFHVAKRLGWITRELGVLQQSV